MRGVGWAGLGLAMLLLGSGGAWSDGTDVIILDKTTQKIPDITR
jgi:hypothetical protein